MESDNIHVQMAQYDFKAPVKVTMIFEENDENVLTEPISIKLENSHKVEEENDNSSILDSVDTNEIKHNTNIELTQIPEVTVQENSKRIASKVVNDSSKEIRVKNAVESIAKHIDNSLKKKTDNECDLDKNSRKLKNNNKDNPNNQNSLSNTGQCKLINNEDVVSNVDGNNNDKHLNDLDNTTLIEINAKILIELLKTVSEHLLIIIKKHFSFLQIQNDKSINLYTLDNFKHCYLRLKYHYFDLSYCTVSTILLPQEKNAGFIGRFLNHTLQLSKEKGINCTYNILETLYFEMIHWAKLKKKHLTNFSWNVSNHNENIMLKQQLLSPPKKIPVPNSGDLHNAKQVQNTCIFSSGPVGRQVKISVAPSLVQQNNQQLNHGTSVPQQNRQLRNEPSSTHQNKQNMSDKSVLVHQIGQPLSVEPSSNYESSQPSMVEPSLTHQETQEINPESSLIHQNRWNVSSESSIHQLNKRQSTTELTSCQQNNHINYDESPLTHQNAQQINSEPSIIWQNKQQINFKQTDPSIQQNIQHMSPVQSSIHQLNKQQLYNEPWSFQQNNQLINLEPSITHLNSEKISVESSLKHQNRKRKINKTTSSWHNRQHVNAEPLPIHQTIPQTAAEQSLIHQYRQPHPSLQNPGTFMQGFRNNIKNVMQPTQCVNYMNCNFSHYNPSSYANYSTNGRYSQHHPYNRYHPPNVFPNYGTAPRAGPPPPNYEDTLFRQHYNDTLNQLRNLSQENHNQEPVTQNPEVLLPNIDTTRSSVSKDSGIMSPLFSETSTDQLNVPLIDLPPSSNVTPLITHVTSLNPNASHIIEGQCTVCQKLTNSKCLGCYKCYYCGHECQTKDWNSHKYICRTASDAY